ncbi:MAG: hypothetical protein QM704_09530 [Anaeromyxobacteraceae bacterium]
MRNTGLALCASCALFGCSSGGSTPPPAEVTITVTGAASSARLGGAPVQFTATRSDGGAGPFAWAVNGTPLGSAALGTIDASGLYAPPAVGAVTLQDPTSVLVTASAGGVSSGPASLALQNPIPTLTACAPASAVLGAGALTVTVTGAGFVPGAAVRWNGATRSTAFVGAAELTATLAAGDLAAAGTAQVTVANPDPGGAVSTAKVFTVENPAPTVTATSPTSVAAGSGAFTLTVDGSGFVPSSVVRWNAADRATTYVSATRLTAAIPADAVAAEASVQVTVMNGAPGGGTSSPRALAVTGAAPGVGVVARASVKPDGTSGNGDSPDAAISASGRFVAFSSTSSNLVAADTNTQYDVYLRDTCLGAPVGCTPDTLLVSANLSGSSSGQECLLGGISADGRHVVFSSYAQDLTADTIPGTSVTNVFLRDTCVGAGPGCTPATRLVTRGVGGGSADSTCSAPAITPDARRVAFSCAATNVVAGDANGEVDVFLHDTCIGAGAGCTPSTQLVSLTAAGAQGNGGSAYPLSISATGRFVVFTSNATNLVPGDTNGGSDVYLRDTCLGADAGCAPTTLRVSLAADGAQPDGWSGFNGNGGGEHLPGVSADGRFVVFTSTATNLVPGDANGAQDVFLRDTCLGASGCTPSTTLVSVGSDGAVPAGSSQFASLSADGRIVAFRSNATNLVSGVAATAGHAYVRDTCAGVASGCTPATRRVSLKGTGTPIRARGRLDGRRERGRSVRGLPHGRERRPRRRLGRGHLRRRHRTVTVPR